MFFINRHKKTQVLAKSRGFSLVELMITMSIMVMVTSAVLVKNAGFSSSTLLASQAQEIALDIRSTQQLGVNSLIESTGSDLPAAGMYFDAAEPGQYQLFIDNDDDNRYDAGEETGEAFLLDSRFVIQEICHEESGARECGSARKASVAFRRPNFDAIIRSSNASGSGYGMTGRTWIEIVVAPVNGNGNTRSVIVYETGQISLE